MDLKKEFSTNAQAEESGVWVPIGDGAKLKICRAGNKNAMQHYRKISKPYSAEMRYDKLKDEIYDRLTNDVTAEFILVDWQGVEYDGKPMSYSKENAVKLLSELKEFKEFVLQIANDRSLFQQEIEEAITKN